jgi:SAM-dependent MidA family methyltransferase
MNISSPLPVPTTEEQELSHKLVQQISKEIQQTTQQTIPFRRFMEMALYEPQLGYYVAGKHKLGHQGDFTTAPEISSLYSCCIAQQCQPVLAELDCYSAEILEFGAGSGAMAAEILRYLDEQKTLPKQYLILEVSPDLIACQKQRFLHEIPHLIEYIQWITELPKNFNGVILANEVLDAMPVDLFSITNNEAYEQHIGFDGAQLRLHHHPASNSLATAIDNLHIKPHSNHYTSEMNPMISPWLRTVAESLTQGIIILIDYGYTRQEYYHPDRNVGTLLCYYQHRAHGDFLYYPGLQDITANVDFTTIAEAADKAELEVLSFTPQATFLIANGLEQHLIQALEYEPNKQYQLAQQVRTLTLPAEMGEHFKVMILGKKINEGLLGFTGVDSRHKL